MNKKTYIIILSLVLVIVWMVAIFWLSSMSGDESNRKSKKTINKALPISAEVTHNTTEMTSAEKTQIVDELNAPLRKCMHASVYFVLSTLSFGFISSLNLKNPKIKYLLPILIAFLYACSDEYHQTFVTGRSGEFRDVLIDTSGSIIAIILIFILSLALKKIKNAREIRKMSNES